jgi:hypothetical protein
MCTSNASKIKILSMVGSGISLVPLYGQLTSPVELSLDDTVKSGRFDAQFSLLISGINSAIDTTSPLRTHLFQTHLARVEAGFSKLRALYAELGSEYLAQRMHHYELRCREYNNRYSIVERKISLIYRISSGYGNSLGRPIIFFFSVWLLSSIFYSSAYNLSHGSKIFPPKAELAWPGNVFNGMSYSLGRMAPFIPWDTKIEYPDGSLEKWARIRDGRLGFLIHLSSLAQTTLSALALFFLGLAAKRRFKVSDK